MTIGQRRHVQQILVRFNRELRAKYARGQREHGGNLWERHDVLDCAIEEAIDLVTYLFTLRDQTRGSRGARDVQMNVKRKGAPPRAKPHRSAAG